MSEKPLLALGDLRGPGGNVFVILGRAEQVACANDMDWDAIHAEAMKSDYDQVLKTMRKYFTVL